ncbi:hypothetical protein HDE_07891 [Halotydeus destructor]|nr:hypothetical protein HDE_07891 [Halotydeus destructor]
MADLVLLAVLVTLLGYATGAPVSGTTASSSGSRLQRPTRGQYVKLSLDDDVYERYKVQPERRPANPRRKMAFRPRARAQTLAYERARAQLVPSPDQLSDDPYDQPANYAGSTGFTDPRGQVPRNSIPWRPEPELEASSEEDSPQLDSPEPEMEEISPSTRGSTGFGGNRRSQSE